MSHITVNLTLLFSLIYINLTLGTQSSIIFPGNTKSSLSPKFEERNVNVDQAPKRQITKTDLNRTNKSTVQNTVIRIINDNDDIKNGKNNLNSLYEKDESKIEEKFYKNKSSFDELSYDFSKTDNIHRVSDLLKFLGLEDTSKKDSEDEKYFQISFRKSNDDPTQVGCHSEWRTIDLATELKKNNEDFKIFPECVKAKRCAGCCGFNSGRICTPTFIDEINVNAAVIRVKRSCDDLTCSAVIDKDNLRKVFKIDSHEECACKCKMSADNCNENQNWDENSCKCICKNNEVLKSTCEKNVQKKWIDKNCECECKKVLACSTGLAFSHKTCSCVKKVAKNK